MDEEYNRQNIATTKSSSTSCSQLVGKTIIPFAADDFFSLGFAHVNFDGQRQSFRAYNERMLGAMVSVVVAGFLSAGAPAKPCSDVRSFDFKNATIRVGVADENSDGPRGMADVFHLRNGSELIYDEFGGLKSENPEWGVDSVDDRVVHPDPSTWLRVIVLVDDHLGGTGTWTYVLAFDCQRGNLVRLFQYSGEGVGLKRLTDQTIEIEQSIWKPNDAHCCPSQEADLSYRWIATLHRFRRVANVPKNADETPSNNK